MNLPIIVMRAELRDITGPSDTYRQVAPTGRARIECGGRCTPWLPRRWVAKVWDWYGRFWLWNLYRGAGSEN